MINDGYKTYFTEKLWEMIPGVYRYEDARGQNAGALRAFVEILAEQAAILRRSHDRLWDDQFIALCDDWAVPYLGDLVGTRLLSALNPRGRRVDVAKTIYYRRRKGTLAVLEELISDITGWEGTVKENFRRLGRAWHRLDPLPTARAGPLSNTPPGGWADLRTVAAAELAGGPFDEFHHTPDMRRHRGGDAVDGRYGIPKLAFHLYRLQAYRVTGAHPCLIQGTTGYTLDPSGRDIPLFMPGNRLQDSDRGTIRQADWGRWHAAREWELPAPLRCRVLAQNKAVLLPHDKTARPSEALRVEIPPSNVIASKSTVAANLTKWMPVAQKTELVNQGMELAVDPERGRLLSLDSAPQLVASVDYHYGFSGPIGAGTYARPDVEQRTPDKGIKKGGALSAANMVLDKGITQIDDSATYGPVADIPAVKEITLQAANYERPYIRLTGDWKIDSGIKDARFVIDGLWIGADNKVAGGVEVIIAGDFEAVTLRHVTLDPGGRRTQDSGSDILPAITLVVEGHVETLTVESCITGPIKTRGNGAIESIEIQNSILQSQKAKLPALALELEKGTVTMERVTVIGKTDVHRLWATETLLTARADVTDIQTGCFRFSAAPKSSRLPRPYEPYWIKYADTLFTSLRYGDPGFGQLSSTAPEELHRGAENGSEIGVFSRLLNPIKLDSLKTKTEEYMPFGLVPIYIEET